MESASVRYQGIDETIAPGPHAFYGAEDSAGYLEATTQAIAGKRYFEELTKAFFLKLEHRSHYRAIIGAYMAVDGTKPGGQTDAVYGLCEDGKLVYSVSRLEVGKGLREYLWLYGKLREFGRGRVRALLEAKQIYSSTPK